MKKFLFIILELCFILPLMADNQANIKATASIIGEITAIGERDLTFGDIPFDSPTTIAYNDVENNSGKFNVSIGPGRPQVLFDFVLPTELDHNGDGPGLTITDWIYGYGASSEEPTVSGPFPVDNQFEINLAGFGRNLDFYIGATVVPNEENLVGNYEATITLIVENN